MQYSRYSWVIVWWIYLGNSPINSQPGIVTARVHFHLAGWCLDGWLYHFHRLPCLQPSIWCGTDRRWRLHCQQTTLQCYWGDAWCCCKGPCSPRCGQIFQRGAACKATCAKEQDCRASYSKTWAHRGDENFTWGGEAEWTQSTAEINSDWHHPGVRRTKICEWAGPGPCCLHWPSLIFGRMDVAGQVWSIGNSWYAASLIKQIMISYRSM